MTHAQRWTLAVVCAATAMLMLDIAVVNTALSAIAADLDTGLSGLQWVVDAYTLPLAATVITAGSLADRFGRRRLFGIGIGVFTATSLLCATAQSITMLNASRAAQGVGAAIMFAVSLAVLSNAFPRMEERVKALAAYGATMGGSFAVGPLVGGALTSALDWRWIFLINLPLGLMCLWIVRRFVAESLDPQAPRVDVAGLVTLTGGLFLLVYALLRGNELGWSSTAIVASFGGAAALLCAFVAVEARVAQPMLPLRFFRNPTFTGAQVAAFGISASLFAMWLYMTLYLQQILGLSAIEAGLVYVPGTLLNFFVAGSMASVGQRVSARVLIAAGLLLVGAGQALLTDRGGGFVVVALPARPARRDGRDGDPEPDGQPRRAQLRCRPSGAVSPRASTTCSARPGSPSASRRSARSCRRPLRWATAHRSPTSTACTTRCGWAPSWPRRAPPPPPCSSAAAVRAPCRATSRSRRPDPAGAPWASPGRRRGAAGRSRTPRRASARARRRGRPGSRAGASARSSRAGCARRGAAAGSRPAASARSARAGTACAVAGSRRSACGPAAQRATSWR